MDGTDKKLIKVSVVFALPTQQLIVPLTVPEGTTAGEAVNSSNLAARFPVIGPQPHLARYGRSIDWNTPLEDGERVDILRPLLADPKEFRRRRAGLQKKAKINKR